MSTWFTADHHFGHKRIIKLASLPFASVEEMDEEMIRRWNAVVAPGDLVYQRVTRIRTRKAAPAVLNAYFAATGKRIRSVPLKHHDITFV